jgi:integrase
MGVNKYVAGGAARWAIDEWIAGVDAELRPVHHRLQKRGFPTKASARAYVSQVHREAREGRWWFDQPAARPEEASFSVAEAWELYEPKAKRDNDSWRSDRSYSRHLIRLMGSVRCSALTLETVDGYRSQRGTETTRRGAAPARATLDREVELLRRMLSYAVACKRLEHNPLAGVSMLGRNNIRRRVVGEAEFAALLEGAPARLRPILVLAYDTGMRKREILDLRWDRVDLREGVIRLEPSDTKEERHRVIYLTARARVALGRTPRRLRCPWVFPNPQMGKPYGDIRKVFAGACRAAGIEGLWFHDLRRSFVTRARKAGIPESVVMRMSGHRTREVFDRYNITDEGDLQAAAARLSAGQRGLGEDCGERFVEEKAKCSRGERI